MSILFVAHDLSVVKHISSRIAIMYLGKIVEIGYSDEVYFKPLHPYSRALISSIPEPKYSDTRKERIILHGEVPNSVNKPSGCVFRTRCPIAKKDCSDFIPELVQLENEHFIACPYSNITNSQDKS